MSTNSSTRPIAKKRSNLARGGVLGVAMAAALVGAVAAPASATPDSSGGSTTAHVGVDAGITMTGLTSSFTLTGTPGATITNSGAVHFNVETNNVAGYAVTVQSEDHVMAPVTSGNLDTIPIGDLKVSEGGFNSYQALDDGSAVTVHTQSERSLNGGDNLTDDYKIRVPVVNADTYSATLDYVATSL